MKVDCLFCEILLGGEIDVSRLDLDRDFLGDGVLLFACGDCAVSIGDMT